MLVFINYYIVRVYINVKGQRKSGNFAHVNESCYPQTNQTFDGYTHKSDIYVDVTFLWTVFNIYSFFGLDIRLFNVSVS